MTEILKALLEKTAEILMFADYELSLWKEDIAYRELEKTEKRMIVKPVLRLPSK